MNNHPKKRAKIWAKTDGACYCCNRPFVLAVRTIDHVVPLSMGGTSAISNLMPCCSYCNYLLGRITESWKCEDATT